MTEPQRHILIVTHYFAPNGGSSADQFTRLAHFLHRRGHRVTVLTTMPHYPLGQIAPDYRGQPFHVVDRDGVRVIYTWLWATPSPRINRKLISQMSFMLMAALRGAGIPRPDAVFIEAQPIFTGLAGRFVSRLKRAPYVLNVSDLWPDHLLSVGALQEDSSAYKIAREAMDSGYRGAAAVATMSPAWTRAVVDYIGGDPAGKVHTIFRGVNLDEFRPGIDTTAFRQQHGLSDKKLVTFIGTFATQYDMHAVMDVAQALDQRPDAQVVIIGTGSQRDIVEERLAADRLANARYIDWLEHDAMPLAWNASAINLWAMRDEALYRGTIPAKIFEAWACGTPIAAAHGGELAQMVSDNGAGLVVEPGDTAGLIAIIERLLDDDSLRAECSANARAYAEAHFNFDAALGRYADLILGAAGKT